MIHWHFIVRGHFAPVLGHNKERFSRHAEPLGLFLLTASCGSLLSDLKREAEAQGPTVKADGSLRDTGPFR